MFYLRDRLSLKAYPIFPEKEVITEKNINGEFVLKASFASADNQESFFQIKEENYIFSGGFTFRIKQVNRDSRRNKREVVCQHVFFDNVWRRQESIIDNHESSHNLETFATFALFFTGWNFFSDIPVNETMDIPNFGKDNALNLVRKICEYFNCDFEIISDTSINFTRPKTDNKDMYLFSYGDNIVALSENVKTDNLRTKITVVGKGDITATYESPNVEFWGVRQADTIYDDSIESYPQAAQLARLSLTDQPEVSIELDTIELLERKLNENVYIIHEPMGFQGILRVTGVTQRYDFNEHKFFTTSVKIGNAIFKTLSNEIIDIKKKSIDNSKKSSNLYRSIDHLKGDQDYISYKTNDNDYELQRNTTEQKDQQQMINFLSNEINRISQEIESLNARLYQQESR